jgi:hypothetical protein
MAAQDGETAIRRSLLCRILMLIPIIRIETLRRSADIGAVLGG